MYLGKSLSSGTSFKPMREFTICKESLRVLDCFFMYVTKVSDYEACATLAKVFFGSTDNTVGFYHEPIMCLTLFYSAFQRLQLKEHQEYV